MIILGTNSIKETGYDVANSLRFNKGSSDYLNRTATSGNRQVATFSGWVKKSSEGVDTNRVFLEYNSGTNYFEIRFREGSSRETIRIYEELNGGTGFELITNREFADLGAWYHIAVVIKTTEGTAANRIKLYINGVQETSFATETYPAQNYNVQMNVADKAVQIGAYSFSGSNYFNGYMSEMVWLDGTAAAITDLGEFDEDSGIWKPIDVSGLTFGNNGFYLEFKQAGTSQNSSGMGADTSGNDNHYAVNNLTAIDQMVDTPTNNYATFNPLIVGEPTATFLGYAEGNLQGSSAGGVSANTILLPTSGKWFVEYHFNNASASSDPGVGFWSIDTSQAHRWYQSSFKGLAWKYNDDVYLNGSNSFTAATFSSGDIISIAVDMDNNRVTFYKNGSAVNNLTNYSFDFTVSLGNFTVGIVDGRTASAGDANFDMNAGQNGTFNGRKTAGGNSDGDGYGNFSMSVPSGYYALNTKNLAEYG